jgi:hypothetical protein
MQDAILEEKASFAGLPESAGSAYSVSWLQSPYRHFLTAIEFK